MSRFEISSLQKSSSWSVYRMRERIKMDPEYQRQGDIWTAEKRKLLIDTMINGFDVPKLYLHKFQSPVVDGSNSFEYAMIDGKQRTQAIFDFIENKFPLDDSFKYLPDNSINLGGLTYRELATKFPDIKQDFDSFSLNIITIDTDDIELIEDLFSRLNEAMPLNAAEKRNARPGPLPRLVREIARHGFFQDKLPFTNNRYRHYDIIAKMLLMASRDHVADTKKVYIDGFFEEHAESSAAQVDGLKTSVEEVLDGLEDVFVDADPLLRSVGMISLYFLMFEAAVDQSLLSQMSRAAFQDFETQRADNRRAAEIDITRADYNLLEFDRFTQSPNDGIAMRFRLAVLDDILFAGGLGFKQDSIL